jgi:formamidopyrimidine-DNA glycosylase
VIVRNGGLRWPISPDISQLEGCEVESGERRGKYLLFTTRQGTLMIHLGMSGSLRVIQAESEWRKHDHVALELDSGMQLRLHDPRRFGAFLLIKGDPLQHPLLAALGPEPLSEAFELGYLLAKLKGRAMPIKQAIMDSHLVVGVGNIYACEALFMAGVSPMKAAGKVSRARLARLVEAIKSVLSASIEAGGTTLRDFLREDGEPGYFKQSLSVYGREGEPCLKCGTTVKRVVMAQRSTFYCPKCQR